MATKVHCFERTHTIRLREFVIGSIVVTSILFAALIQVLSGQTAQTPAGQIDRSPAMTNWMKRIGVGIDGKVLTCGDAASLPPDVRTSLVNSRPKIAAECPALVGR